MLLAHFTVPLFFSFYLDKRLLDHIKSDPLEEWVLHAANIAYDVQDTGAWVGEAIFKGFKKQQYIKSSRGIGTLSRVRQSVNLVVFIGPEAQKGRLKPYVADIAINLWGRDLLQQWNTQINIPPESNTNHVQSLDSRKDLVGRYGKRLPTIQAVQKLGTNDRPSEEPKALSLKWLMDKPVWVGQWPMTSVKLEALEKLVQEQLEAGHIQESTSPWNSPVFVIKKKSGKWRMLTDLRAINKDSLGKHLVFCALRIHCCLVMSMPGLWDLSVHMQCPQGHPKGPLKADKSLMC
ncbi:HERV-K-7p22.1 provirus ancestral Pol protein [Cricetulus griseus]|uniref:HERV-K-7p22.1 provirus ancestral Pol protein n=1 Tax=Cricetulus griseus TaxID=10029 RepID=A0A061IJM3_CRIGR|nr:HERV-K-7p22.1 provirus ancestral Pol protein [Cricetulus griseus]